MVIRNFWRNLRLKSYSKFENIKTVVDGIEFHSKKEAKRYVELRMLERAKRITNLKLQPKFEIRINGAKVFTYKADFEYFEDGVKYVVEDVKGFRTPVYRIKIKCFRAMYPKIDFRET